MPLNLSFLHVISNGGGHPDRPISFRLMQLIVIFVRVITPFSYIYLSALLFATMVYPKAIAYGLIPKMESLNFIENINNFIFRQDICTLSKQNKFIFSALTIYCMMEALFFCYYYYLFTKLNDKRNDLDHFASTPEKRKKLVENCFEAMMISCETESIEKSENVDPKKHIRRIIEGWFLDIPIIEIYYGNFFSWCGWAFFGKDINSMSKSEIEENKSIVEYIERQAGWKFPPGYSNDVFSARLTLDPLFATQRPFIIYLTIAVFNTLTHLVLFAWGYRRRRELDTAGQSVYYRKGTPVLSAPSADKATVFPIVFVHGIGIGFTHYLGAILTFPTEVDSYLVEWPYVAYQLASDAPKIDSTVKTFIDMLNADGHAQACFAAHSLGSTAVSWMLHDDEGKKRVASTVLLDPVVFLLCDPTVATTFVYKDPKDTVDFLMHFCLSRELFIANALSRHFNWSHNILFVEDLADAFPRPDKTLEDRKRSGSRTDSAAVNHTIFLSSHDSIVPVGKVQKYLEFKMRGRAIQNASESSGSITNFGSLLSGASNGFWGSGKKKEEISGVGKCFEVLFFHGVHGEMFIYPQWLALISSKIRERCSN